MSSAAARLGQKPTTNDTPRRGRPPLSESDLGPVDRTPHGTGRRGPLMASRFWVTALGWALVSPEVRARISRTDGTS